MPGALELQSEVVISSYSDLIFALFMVGFSN